jgi:tetratricopeptide (TPR) repeat protein
VPVGDLVTEARRLDLDGQHGEAVALYRQALERTPDSFDVHYGLARALDLHGEYAEARQHFATAVDLAPDNGSRDQALRMLGVSWTFVGNAQEAAGAFTQVFDRRRDAGELSSAAEVANELGRVLLELGRPDEAFEWYRTGYTTASSQADRRASEIDLAELRWAHAQARIAARQGDPDEARRQTAIVQALVEKDTNPDQQIQYPYLAGYVAFHEGDDDEAIAELSRADREDPFILLLLAQAYERSGDDAAAQEAYERVLASTSHAVTNALARPAARRALASAPGAG